MKLKADRATLLKALAHVQSVVERRNTIPILANVMIAVRDGKLSLTATDMEIAIVEDGAATTTRNGPPTAPAGARAPPPPHRCMRPSPGCPMAPTWNGITPAATHNWRCGRAGMR